MEYSIGTDRRLWIDGGRKVCREDIDITRYFGYDMIGVGPNMSFRMEHRIIEYNVDTYIERNEFGMTQRQ